MIGTIRWAKAYWKGWVTSLAIMHRGDLVAAGVLEKKIEGTKLTVSGGFLARLSPEGDVKWVRILEPYWLRITDLKVVDNWEIVACGRTENAGVVFKFDGDGNLIWARKFEGGVSDAFRALSIDRRGGIIVVGKTRSFGAGVSNALIAKLDRWGDIMWWKTSGGRLWDGAQSVTIDAKGRIVVAGYTYSFGRIASDAWILWFDRDGELLMERTYSAGGLEKATSIVPAGDGGFMILGNAYDPLDSRYDAWLLHVDEAGEPTWGLRFPGLEERDVSIDPSGNLMIGMEKSMVLKVDPGGNILLGGQIRLKKPVSIEALLARENLVVGGRMGYEWAFLASVVPSGKPPAAVEWKPEVRENRCVVFDCHSKCGAGFKVAPSGKIIGKTLNNWEFNPDIFTSFRELRLRFQKADRPVKPKVSS
ncbi:hypothetical protein [Thermococcus sp. AM4]|uniref:hypothetical protein n=1 Tax=Thermococcus sp. (strain AM4) TaxID=246969 RepID=UPI0001871048|nr:hypothetical protein [Thermococcus sp. AM4]EEB73561.1 conserved hypothetical protein [Thermococcus sp. AM4]